MRTKIEIDQDCQEEEKKCGLLLANLKAGKNQIKPSKKRGNLGI